MSRILSIGRFLPWDGIDHAGGKYVHVLYKELVLFGSLKIIAPNSYKNRIANNDPSSVKHVKLAGVKDGKLHDILNQLGWYLNPAKPELSLRMNLWFSSAFRSQVSAAEVIDLQWGEYSTLAKRIKRINPDAKIVCTHHDVLIQKFDRLLETKKRKFGFRIYKKIFERAKKTYLSTFAYVDEVLVFSDKDKDLLISYRPDFPVDRIQVVNPPLFEDVKVSSSEGKPEKNQILFVGAMARKENDEAAKWFIEEIWDSEPCPNYTFAIAGSNPSHELKTMVAERSNVELLGFVTDLDATYNESSVVVIPLLRGAGVKFKTLEALISGTPVITTSIGAEGIGGEELYWAIADQGPAFRASLVELLDNLAEARKKAESAQAWAQDNYSVASFKKRVPVIYGTGSEKGNADE